MRLRKSAKFEDIFVKIAGIGKSGRLVGINEWTNSV